MPLVACRECGQPRQAATGTQSVWCHPCRRSHHKTPDPQPHQKRPTTRRCADCGTERPISRHCRPEGQFRCQPCRRARPERQPKPKARRPTWQCIICGVDVMGRRAGLPGKYCEQHRSHRRQRYRTTRCAWCRTTCVTKGKYCTKCTAEEVWRHQPRNMQSRRDRKSWNDEARARYHGVTFEPVDRARVYQRDRWRCGICMRPVSKRLTYPHPRSATLDHIVPMARGGDHTYLNTQCAHLECNVAKCDGGSGEQLALIG